MNKEYKTFYISLRTKHKARYQHDMIQTNKAKPDWKTVYI